MNKLFLGFSKQIDLPKSKFLFIDDELPTISQRHRIFDPSLHSFNPLKDIDDNKAEALADLFYTTTPGGENTLRVRDGKLALAPALLKAKYLDQVDGNEEVTALRDGILFSALRRRVLCSRANDFSFDAKSVVLARLNRKELGDRTALILGLLLIAQFKGQIVIPDFGFYGRDAHIGLIREERLIAGVNFLDELSPRLRNAVLLIKDKQGHGALYEDAETLANFAGLIPGTNGYNDFVADAMR